MFFKLFGAEGAARDAAIWESLPNLICPSQRLARLHGKKMQNISDFEWFMFDPRTNLP
jgi:hypothetical protein